MEEAGRRAILPRYLHLEIPFENQPPKELEAEYYILTGSQTLHVIWSGASFATDPTSSDVRLTAASAEVKGAKRRRKIRGIEQRDEIEVRTACRAGTQHDASPGLP